MDENEGDRGAVHELLVPGAVTHDLTDHGHDALGAEGFLEFYDRFKAAMQVDDVVIAGNKMAVGGLRRAAK